MARKNNLRMAEWLFLIHRCLTTKWLNRKVRTPKKSYEKGLKMELFGKTRWGILDCLTGAFVQIERFPFQIGCGGDCQLILTASAMPLHCALVDTKDKGICLLKSDPAARLAINGVEVEHAELKPEQDYSLQIGTHLLALRGSKKLEAWRNSLDHKQWFVFDPDTKISDGPKFFDELCQLAQTARFGPQASAAVQGLAMGFFLPQILSAHTPANGTTTAAPVAEDHLPSPPSEVIVNAEHGTLTCPVCWLKFDPGDIMHVAVHDSLRGDPILGDDVQQRFHATRFNDLRQALDAFGLPCTEIACPHCRWVMPFGFAEVPHYIFSIVGDQSAGKSYFLSVLIKVLPTRLFQDFSVVFQDADPAGNALLNDMKKALFSAQNPEQARLVKTQLEGAMYVRLQRYGRFVMLPRPFVFSLKSVPRPEERCSIVFYDNAGEHFQPGRDSADSPGAQHIASSSGLLFLFDPFNNSEFRKRISGQPDPQMEKPLLDQQDVILSELKLRIQKLLRLNGAAKIKQPLAILIGKCDAWMHLLGQEPFQNPVVNRSLNLAAVRHNSTLVRSLILDICPGVVANAEEISQSVMYFPVSAFGHPPMKIGAGDYVPDPAKLKPFMVEIPSLWLLSQIRPDLVPSV